MSNNNQSYGIGVPATATIAGPILLYTAATQGHAGAAFAAAALTATGIYMLFQKAAETRDTAMSRLCTLKPGQSRTRDYT